MSTRPKIVLLGMLTKMPVGGVAWLVGHYVLGFERLGFDVHYVEAHARTPSMFVGEGDDGTDQAAAYLARIMTRFGLHDRWAFHALHADGRCVGMSDNQLADLYRDAALIINMHGGTVPLPEHSAGGKLALLSTDPVELELEVERDEQGAIDFLEAHVAYFTWGLNHGNPDCRVPWDERFPFVPSAPPVLLDHWADGVIAPDAPMTTIGNWRQDWRSVSYKGERYGWSKHEEFLKVIDLPDRVSGGLELALSSATDDDRAMLRDHGWRIVDGLAVSQDMDDYRAYIQRSLGEFTVAKDQNVRFRSGWFSERSACYLAAGRPVITQDTGFGSTLPTGCGLLTFSDVEAAATAISDTRAHPERHRRAAREIAQEHLSYDVVLPAMLDHLGLPVPNRRTRVPAARGESSIPAELCVVPTSRRPLILEAHAERTILNQRIPALSTEAMRPRVSVVMVVLDNPAVTRMAAESILADTRPDMELVIVDNGSQLLARHYLSVLSARQTRVRVLRNDENLGFAAGANQGLAVTAGDVIVLVNNDIVAPPGWLDMLVNELDDPAIGLVGPVTNRCGNEAEIAVAYATYSEMTSMAHARARQPHALFDIPVATMFCLAMRRTTYESVGALDERFEFGLFEDDDYSRRVRDKGFRVVCAPHVFVHHFGEASLGQMAAEGRYGALFEANRRRFEEKWCAPWRSHERTPRAEYTALVARVIEAMERTIPEGATVAVVSKGDDAMVAQSAVRIRHFPCTPGGDYIGHHPADDADALAHLATQRASGASHLVIPATSRWWLTHYRGFARHLHDDHTLLLDEAETGLIYYLKPTATTPKGPHRSTGSVEPTYLGPLADDMSVERKLAQMSARLETMEELLDDLQHPQAVGPVDPHVAQLQSMRELIRREVPWGCSVLVAGASGGELIGPPGRPTIWFDLQCAHRIEGDSDGLDCECAVARLEAQRANGAEFVLVASEVITASTGPTLLADHLVGYYAVAASVSSTLLFDVRARRQDLRGWSRTLPEVTARIANLLAHDVAVLDWTRLNLLGQLGQLNVFTSASDTDLPYIDHSVPIVLVDHPEKRHEAERVAGAVVISVGVDLRPVSMDCRVVDATLEQRLAKPLTIDVVLTTSAPDPRWLEHVHQALSDQVIGCIATADSAASRTGDVVLILEPGVLPLPGGLDAAIALLGRGDIGAVAGRLLDADGVLISAGVTVFSDGSWSGTARGHDDIAAPWHNYVRDTPGGAGMLALTRAAFDDAWGRGTVPVTTVDWSASVWAAGHRVTYQPEALFVQTDMTHANRIGRASGDWNMVIARLPKNPGGATDQHTWRTQMATHDVSGCWHDLVEVAVR